LIRLSFNNWQLGLFLDHYSPPPNIETAALHTQQRKIAKQHDLFIGEEGEGVGHQIAIEKLVGGGQIAIGVDSHTCTVGALGALGFRQPPVAVANAIINDFARFDIPKVLRVELEGQLPSNCCAKDLMLHLATYGQEFFEDKLIEFGGMGLKNLSISSRFTMCNLSTDLHARTAICETDEITKDYLSLVNKGNTFIKLSASPSVYEE
jgi:homoaconitase/3-isopropylmalate dehydratase large subunit